MPEHNPTRNVVDSYRYWETEAVKADLDLRRHEFSILIVNELREFNVGTVVRNSNAFLGKRIYLLGHKRYDRRGAVGTYLYEHIVHVRSLAELPELPIVSVDNVEGASPIEDFVWPEEHFLMAFGQEQVGLPPELLARAASTVYITQYGSVRSLNVGTASGIAMYDSCRKLAARGPRPGPA
jgi:tRNA G18 (ribose-2'-O)-methylase SpoU